MKNRFCQIIIDRDRKNVLFNDIKCKVNLFLSCIRIELGYRYIKVIVVLLNNVSPQTKANAPKRVACGVRFVLLDLTVRTLCQTLPNFKI